jgi:mRNA interferase RelE/StbE
MIGYRFTTYADRQLRKLPLETQRRLIEKLRHYLATEDPLHFADTIEGERGKVYRFRIGDYRLIFDWLGHEILVTKVGPRGRIY